MVRCIGLVVLLSVVPLMLVGCQGDRLATIDDELASAIRQRWRQSVGHDSDVDPNVSLSKSAGAASAQAYATTPATQNPRAADLTAQPSQTRRVGPDGEILAPDVKMNRPDNAVNLDLTSALGYSVAHARDYRSRKEDLFIAAINLLIERHLWGPRFFQTLTTEFTGTPEGGDYEHAFELVNEFRVSQRLPYGGEVSARALVNFVSLLHDPTGNQDDTQDASIILAARIPLLRGAGVVARESLIQSERNLVYASRRFERYRRQFLLDIATRYYDLLRQQAQVRNLQRQLKSFQWLSERIEALATAGRQPFFEVQRAQQQVLFARNNLLNAEENYETQLDSFKLQIGMAVSQSLVIQPTEIEIPEPALDMEQAIRVALAQRLDLQNTRDQLDDAHRAVKVARNQLLPDLDVTGRMTVNTQQDKNASGLDFELSDSTYAVGVELDAPWDRRQEQLRYRRALIDLERAHRELTKSEDEVAQDVRRSVRQIEQAAYTLELQRRNIDVASKRLRGVVLRLRTLGPRDFIEAEGDLLEAQNRRDFAVRDLRVSILQYLLGAGQMRVGPEGQWLAPAKLSSLQGGGHGGLTPQQIMQKQAGEKEIEAADWDKVVEQEQQKQGATREPGSPQPAVPPRQPQEP